MKILNISHKEVSINPERYIIDWDKVVSAPQKIVSDFLYRFWGKDIVLQEFRIPNSLLRIDLFNVTKKVIVEVSPDEVHGEYNLFFHKNRLGFLKNLKADIKKMNWAERNGFKFVEMNSFDIKNLSVDLLIKKGVLSDFNIHNT